MERLSLLNTGIAFATFTLSGKLPVENNKFAISDIRLIRAVWENFENLPGKLAGPVDLLLLKLYLGYKTIFHNKVALDM